MQDQQFIQQWSAGHDRFSTDLDRGLGHLLRHFARRAQSTPAIDRSYGFLAKYAAPAASEAPLSPAAQASLRGLAASVITFALWVTVMLLATPAPGLASTVVAPAGETHGHLVPALA